MTLSRTPIPSLVQRLIRASHARNIVCMRGMGMMICLLAACTFDRSVGNGAQYIVELDVTVD
jgi:hypothetical protein